MRSSKLSIIKKIKNQNWVDISLNDLYELNNLDFEVKRGTKHHTVFHKNLIGSPRFSSGTIVIGAHKKDKERLDFNGAQDLKKAFQYLGYM